MKKLIIRLITSISICTVLFLTGLFLYKLYRHEMDQNNKLTNLYIENRNLQNELEYLETKLNQSIEYYNYDTNYQDDSFNYFAIGNSLTLIPSWGRGICSTKPDNDYFNLVVKYLASKHKTVIAYPYNFSSWETLKDKKKTLSLINKYLDPKLDLITIQLGENCTTLDSYQKDLEYLINYIKQLCPKAKILIIGDWWSFDRNELRKQATLNTSCIFVDLSEVIGDKNYQSQEGIECLMCDGSIQKVSKEASTHPNDKGMKLIADKIINILD